MRVYHFVSAMFGLDDLRRRRLKIATLADLNDPFELAAVSVTDKTLRQAFHAMKQELSKNRGLLCFSRSWRNPVMWSHYAEKHKGVCLGFDVPVESLGPVSYSDKRLVVELEKLKHPRSLDVETARRVLFTKFSHWRYENEVRCFVTLDERDAKTGLYFVGFSPQLMLREVIVGAASAITRAELRDALGVYPHAVDMLKGRLAFGSFNIVRQRNEKLWA